MDRDEFLALQRAEAAEAKASENDHEITTLLWRLKSAEVELAESERSYEARMQSFAAKS